MRSSELRKLKLFEMRIKTWNFRTTTYGVRSNAFLTSLSAHCAVCGGRVDDNDASYRIPVVCCANQVN